MSIKAFDIVSAIDKVSPSDKVKILIYSFEYCGRDLYIGTSDSFVLHYFLEEKTEQNGAVTYNSNKCGHKYLGFKKPVTSLKAVSVVDRLLCLCDGNLQVLNLSDLEPFNAGVKLKGITCICINENSSFSTPFSVQVCVGKRRQLQLFTLTDEKMIHVKDISIPETPLVMAMDGIHVCVAMSTQYVMVNAEHGHIQYLFPLETDTTEPLVKRIFREEFLLSGPGSLGMVVTTEGISERPPLPWDSDVISATYSHPYVICLSYETLKVYSLLDQQLKQVVPFFGGRYVDNFNHKLLIACDDSIFALIPVPWEKQVQVLLGEKKVKEALSLALNSNKAGISKEHFNKIYQKFQQQAGFIEFSQFKFSEAKDYFLDGHLDARELIALYPGLLPASSIFIPSKPALHDIRDIEDMCTGHPEMLSQCKNFLIEYLTEISSMPEASQWKLELDTALVKLCAEMNSPNLLSLLSNKNLKAETSDIAECLLPNKHYHSLASFYASRGESIKALQIWSRIVTKEYEDKSFPGLQIIVDYLISVADQDLILKYAGFVLERDQDLGAKLFIEHSEQHKDLKNAIPKPEVVVEVLQRFPVAITKYLEYLVYKQKCQKEQFHTHLAVLYLDAVIHLIKEDATSNHKIQEARARLQKLLKFSSSYRVHLLLSKVLDAKLYTECAILYGKLEEHEKALKIFVHELNDYKAAEEYCHSMARAKGGDRRASHRLFHTLLGIYLDPSLDIQKREVLIDPAIRLLNSEVAEFDVVKVLQLLPEHWSIATVVQFLNKGMRSMLHMCRTSRVENALSRCENAQVRFRKYLLESEPIILTEERSCPVCNRPFLEPAFAKYPSGMITHPQCAKSKHLCPVTGKRFTASSFGANS